MLSYLTSCVFSYCTPVDPDCAAAAARRDPEAAVREVGGLRQGALQAPSPLRRVLQGDAPGGADGLVGDAQHLHLLLSHVDFPLQGGLEGEGDEQIAADPGAEQQDAQRRQGDLPGEPHSGTSSR